MLHLSFDELFDLFGNRLPDLDDHVVAFLTGEVTFAVVLLNLLNLLVAFFDFGVFAFDVVDVRDGNRDGGDHREAEALVFDLVEDSGGLGGAVFGEELVDERSKLLLADWLAEWEPCNVLGKWAGIFLSIEVADGGIHFRWRDEPFFHEGEVFRGFRGAVIDIWEVVWEDIVEDDLTDGCDEVFALHAFWHTGANILMDGFGWDSDTAMEWEAPGNIGHMDLVDIVEDFAFGKGVMLIGFDHAHDRSALGFVNAIGFLLGGNRAEFGCSFEEVGRAFFGGEVEVTKNHILARDDNRLAITRRKDVIGSKHKVDGFLLGCLAKWDVDGHLVTVEVRVESRADKRMETDCASIDEFWLEGLDGETVQGWCTVEQDRVIADDLLNDIEDDWLITINDLVGSLVGGDMTRGDEDRGDEWAEKLDRHFAWKTALIHLEVWSNGDDGTARIVDTFAEEVLTEASLFAL